MKVNLKNQEQNNNTLELNSLERKSSPLTDKLTSDDYDNSFYKYYFFFLFFAMGLINNIGYVLILVGSSDLSKDLNNPNLIALYPLSLILCSSIARLVNSRYLIKTSYRIRIIFLTFYFLLGYISLFLLLNATDHDSSINKETVFYLSLIPSFIMGTGSAFGEAVVLGYLRNFPKNLVSGWSSGTGLAGVTGALITLLFKIYNVKTKTLYITISPVCFIYFIAFYIIEKLRPTKIDNEMTINNEASNNKQFTLANFWPAFKDGKRFIINLFTVYYLEYTILTGFSERVNKYNYITGINQNELYEYFGLCYQIGVFISRSCLFLLKYVKHIEILTFLQVFSFIFWIVQVYTGFFSSFIIAFLSLIIVGLMGGGSYVYCYYSILNSEVIAEEYKELCVNIGTIFNDCGILLASLSVLIFDNTIMK